MNVFKDQLKKCLGCIRQFFCPRVELQNVKEGVHTRTKLVVVATRRLLFPFIFLIGVGVVVATCSIASDFYHEIRAPQEASSSQHSPAEQSSSREKGQVPVGDVVSSDAESPTQCVVTRDFSCEGYGIPVAAPVMIFGMLGGFVSIQRKLKVMPIRDLYLICKSWDYTLLSPMVGSILAIMLYLLFIGGIVDGNFFPKVTDYTGCNNHFKSLFYVTLGGPSEYAKLLVWSFLAGFSETFVTRILGQLESK